MAVGDVIRDRITAALATISDSVPTVETLAADLAALTARVAAIEAPKEA